MRFEKTHWVVVAALVLAAGLHAAPTVNITGTVNGQPAPAGTVVARGSAITYSVTVTNADKASTIPLLATVTYDDAGVSKQVQTGYNLTVLTVIRPVITLSVPATLALNTTSLATSGDWPGQGASYNPTSRTITWMSGNDLVAGSYAVLTFSGTVP